LLERSAAQEAAADHERHLEEVKPLVEIGECPSFIEQESITYSNHLTARDDPKQEILDAGNGAVRGGNIVANAATIRSLEQKSSQGIR